MADYKTIKGYKVVSYATDPTPQQTGRVWYNTTGYVLKYSENATTAAWASVTATPTALMHGAAAGDCYCSFNFWRKRPITCCCNF